MPESLDKYYKNLRIVLKNITSRWDLQETCENLQRFKILSIFEVFSKHSFKKTANQRAHFTQQWHFLSCLHSSCTVRSNPSKCGFNAWVDVLKGIKRCIYLICACFCCLCHWCLTTLGVDGKQFGGWIAAPLMAMDLSMASNCDRLSVVAWATHSMNTIKGV